MNLLNNIKAFCFFLSKPYWNQVHQATQGLTAEMMNDWLISSRRYLPNHGLTPYQSLNGLKELFEQKDFPCSLKESELPADLLGIFIPPIQSHKPSIVLNSATSHKGMHLSTLGHEIGHLMVALYDGFSSMQANLTNEPNHFQARTEDLVDVVNDPKELVADLGASLGIYPKADFERIFCNQKGNVLWLYQKLPLLLFLRGSLYIAAQFPELRKNLVSCPYKIFHFTLTLHYLRLRVFLREAYGM